MRKSELIFESPVPLSLVNSKEKVKLDFDDWLIVRYKTWYYSKTGNKRYVARRQYNRDTGKYHFIYLHRLIMGLKSGENPRLQIDHIDGDTLNNCKSNLRFCGSHLNCINSKFRINNTSGYKGVTPRKLKTKTVYYATIRNNYKVQYIGSFNTPEQAAKAYDLTARYLYGKFARCNFEPETFTRCKNRND